MFPNDNGTFPNVKSVLGKTKWSRIILIEKRSAIKEVISSCWPCRFPLEYQGHLVGSRVGKGSKDDAVELTVALRHRLAANYWGSWRRVLCLSGIITGVPLLITVDTANLPASNTLLAGP